MTVITRKIKLTPDSDLRQLQIYEQAYEGYDGDSTPEFSPHHPGHMLSRAELNDSGTKRLWRPRNFLAKVAEEPVGYLGLARPRINVMRVGDDGTLVELDVDLSADKQIQARIDSFYQAQIRPRQADLVLWQGLYGQSFAKIAYNPGEWRHIDSEGQVTTYKGQPGLHVVAYPRLEAGVERAVAYQDSEDPDLVTSAAVFWFERKIEQAIANSRDEYVKHAQLLYPDRIEWLVLDGSGWRLDPDRSQSGTGIDMHPWGVTPLAICWNNAKPDLHDGIDAQMVINKDIYDQNAAQQQVAFPQRYRVGLIPQGGWLRNPLTGQREVVDPLRSGPHVVWDVPDGGSVGQLPSDPGTFPLAKYEQDVRDLAALTRSVAVAKMMSSTETSGSSKAMDTAQLLEPRLQEKAEGLAACIRDIYRIVFAMAKTDPQVAGLLGIDTGEELIVEVAFEVNLDRDKQAEDQLDHADRAAKNLSLATYLQRRGLTESEARKEAERLKSEREESMAEQAEAAQKLDPYGTFGGPPRPGPASNEGDA
jgi:hypothetical protein